jgi:glucokinase
MIGAVDIGGAKIAVGVVDGAGRVLCKMEVPTGADFDYSDGLDLVVGILRDAAQNPNGEVSGIGIGSTGPVDPIYGGVWRHRLPSPQRN